MFRVTLILSLCFLTLACSTAVKRTRSSDPVMRIAIDPKSMNLSSYVRLQRALVESGKFVVVDRSNGFKFIDREQRLQHKDKEKRVGSDERYAEWGKLYGVGGVVVGIQSCQMRTGWGGDYYRCLENLALIDVTTGETLAVSEDTQDTEEKQINPNWTRAVEAMVDNYPRVFENLENIHQTVKYSQTLQDYRTKISQQKEEDRKPASQQE